MILTFKTDTLLTITKSFGEDEEIVQEDKVFSKDEQIEVSLFERTGNKTSVLFSDGSCAIGIDAALFKEEIKGHFVYALHDKHFTWRMGDRWGSDPYHGRDKLVAVHEVLTAVGAVTCEDIT